MALCQRVLHAFSVPHFDDRCILERALENFGRIELFVCRPILFIIISFLSLRDLVGRKEGGSEEKLIGNFLNERRE